MIFLIDFFGANPRTTVAHYRFPSMPWLILNEFGQK
jgi:hypothetical protein